MSMYGWGVKIRRALVVTMLTSCVYVMGDAINAVWTGSDRGYAYSPMYCFLDFGVSYTVVVVDNCCKFLYPSPNAWSSVIRPFLVPPPLQNVVKCPRKPNRDRVP